LNPATKTMLSGLLRVLVSLLLIAVLAFLYVMSQTGDLRRQPQVSTYLRQLREIDSRWNRDLAAARSDSISIGARPPAPGRPLQPILDGLLAETQALQDPTLSTGLEGLQQAFVQKQNLVQQFDQQSEALRAQLRTVLAQIAAIRSAAATAPDALPAARARFSGLDSQLVSLNAELLRLYVQPDDALRASIWSATAGLQQQAEALTEALRTPLIGITEPVAMVLQQEAALGELAREVDLLPTAPRVTSMIDAYDRAFQAMSDEKERYRVYLVFYSAALLVFLGYVLWQLGRSNVKLNQANDALRSSNETLEHRVDERTKELSEALKHLKESELLLVQTEKMSSLGQMVAGIAHEINTPLAYVKSSLATLAERLPVAEGVVSEAIKLVAMLERGDAPDAELSEQFARVSTLAARFQAESEASQLQSLNGDALHGIDQISEIILNLKNFSRLDRSKVSRFNLNEGLESTLVIARNMIKHKTVNRRFAEIPLIECSPSQINQVFLNLVTNAAQATKDDASGQITIATSLTPNGFVRVDISDNGHGIPENIMSKIFDPFFTTKDVGQGTGLGLSIAYKIIQEHGGRIDVKSKVGQGTTFSVLLPARATTPQALAA
jgi:two-component system, NtrC family, sensor kinase